MSEPFMEMFVKSVSSATTKSNKPYLRLDLRGADGNDYPGVIWDDVEKLAPKIKVGNVYVFDADQTQYNGSIQYTIFGAEQVKDPDFSQFMDPSPVDGKSIASDLFTLLNKVENEFYKGLINTFIADKYLRSLLWTVPATPKFHHTYMGGLVHYIYRCVDLADTISSKYENIDRDLLLTAAFFHDIGKIFEYELVGATFVQSTRAKLFGHSTLSLELIHDLTNRVTKGSDFLRPEYMKLQHIVVAHHVVEGDSRVWGPSFMSVKEGELLIRIASICSILGHYDRLSPDETGWSEDGKKYLE